MNVTVIYNKESHEFIDVTNKDELLKKVKKSTGIKNLTLEALGLHNRELDDLTLEPINLDERIIVETVVDGTERYHRMIRLKEQTENKEAKTPEQKSQQTQTPQQPLNKRVKLFVPLDFPDPDPDIDTEIAEILNKEVWQPTDEQVLKQYLQDVTELSISSISKNFDPAMIARILLLCPPTLRSLDLTANHLSSDLEPLTEALQGHPQLEEINLTNTVITADTLAPLLSAVPNLKTLKFSFVEGREMAVLADVISDMTVKNLLLPSNTGLWTKYWQKICKALAFNASITNLGEGVVDSIVDGNLRNKIGGYLQRNKDFPASTLITSLFSNSFEGTSLPPTLIELIKEYLEDDIGVAKFLNRLLPATGGLLEAKATTFESTQIAGKTYSLGYGFLPMETPDHYQATYPSEEHAEAALSNLKQLCRGYLPEDSVVRKGRNIEFTITLDQLKELMLTTREKIEQKASGENPQQPHEKKEDNFEREGRPVGPRLEDTSSSSSFSSSSSSSLFSLTHRSSRSNSVSASSSTQAPSNQNPPETEEEEEHEEEQALPSKKQAPGE